MQQLLVQAAVWVHLHRGPLQRHQQMAGGQWLRQGPAVGRLVAAAAAAAEAGLAAAPTIK